MQLYAPNMHNYIYMRLYHWHSLSPAPNMFIFRLLVNFVGLVKPVTEMLTG